MKKTTTRENVCVCPRNSKRRGCFPSSSSSSSCVDLIIPFNPLPRKKRIFLQVFLEPSLFFSFFTCLRRDVCIQHLNVALYFALFKKNKDKVDVRYGNNQYQHLLFHLPLLFSSLLSHPPWLSLGSKQNGLSSLLMVNHQPTNSNNYPLTLRGVKGAL